MNGHPGTLLDRFFQLGYIVRNLDGALAAFRARFGKVEFQIVQGQARYPHTKRIALGYVGPVMIEFIEPDPDVPSLYSASIRTTMRTRGSTISAC